MKPHNSCCLHKSNILAVFLLKIRAIRCEYTGLKSQGVYGRILFNVIVIIIQVENEESERTEMEVGVRGGVYNVSNVEGMAKITPKTLSPTDSTQDKMVVSSNKSA